MAIVIEENKELQSFNTFKIKAKARYWAQVQSLDDIHWLIQQPVFLQNKHFILGGGSNCVFMHDFDGIVIKVAMRGIEIINETSDTIKVKVASGEGWHDFVLYCLDKNWGGVENLALIPGTVGAAPIQNIGAYGVEVKECIESVHGIDLTTGIEHSYKADDCQFSYRDSIFKHDSHKNFFISSVTLRLNTNNHIVNTSYSVLRDYLSKENNHTPTIQNVARVVMAIRRSKLPDPSVLGNAGSFFKNPVVTVSHLHTLQKSHPAIPFYTIDNQYVKIPAGWLIETAGWKGKQREHVGVHDQQALVIVNLNHATGKEVFTLSEQIMNDVQLKFGIQLTREVNMIA